MCLSAAAFTIWYVDYALDSSDLIKGPILAPVAAEDDFHPRVLDPPCMHH